MVNGIIEDKIFKRIYVIALMIDMMMEEFCKERYHE